MKQRKRWKKTRERARRKRTFVINQTGSLCVRMNGMKSCEALGGTIHRCCPGNRQPCMAKILPCMPQRSGDF